MPENHKRDRLKVTIAEILSRLEGESGAPLRLIFSRRDIYGFNMGIVAGLEGCENLGRPVRCLVTRSTEIAGPPLSISSIDWEYKDSGDGGVEALIVIDITSNVAQIKTNINRALSYTRSPCDIAIVTTMSSDIEEILHKEFPPEISSKFRFVNINSPETWLNCSLGDDDRNQAEKEMMKFISDRRKIEEKKLGI